jgi:DNA helicase-2/ATP-dependent DNA helicase PcrA
MSDPSPAIDFAKELNAAQLQAVQAVDGASMVIAGPGSGKTRTLVYRVAHLVLEGVPPESILLLTFTRKASQEMLRRAAALLDERCQRVAGGTFHSFANLVLRRYADLLGYDRGFTILDRSDAEDLVGVLRAEAGYASSEKRFAKKRTILSLFSKRANTRKSLEEILAQDYPQFAGDLEALTDLEGRYQARKKAQNVVDYDDLLVLLRRLLVEHDAVRQRLSGRYRYVMVDEYQDTNHLQAHIAALLASGHGNLMVVGDDAQSIYAFRGASFRNIIEFPKVFPKARQVLLEENYRSTQGILDLANGILARAREKFDKKLFTRLQTGPRPVSVTVPDDAAQSLFIRRRILELREEGVPLQEIAVLSRAAWHTNSLEVELASAKIPFRKFGGLKFIEAAHVKDVTALLKVVANPLDSASWFRVLQLFEGIGPKTAQQLIEAVAAAGGKWQALREPPASKRRSGEALGRLSRFLDALAVESLSVAERMAAAVTFYRPLLVSKYDDAARRARDLEALESIAERYRSLESFLSDVALEPPEFSRQGERDPEEEWMTVSTVHSAKGLEWHSVFILNLNSGFFPSQRSLAEDDDYEEERRLLYVAVTRAKRNLYLVRPEELPQRGPYGTTYAEISPLLEEIEGFDQLVEAVHFDPLDEDGDFESSESLAGDASLLGRIEDFFGD